MVTAAARQRDLPVVEAMGAMVETAGPCLYRGWFLTRALDGVTLWNLLLSGERDRAEAIAQARTSVDRLHDGGLYRADLNFHNLFVCGDERPPRVVALDLDKARLYPDALACRRAGGPTGCAFRAQVGRGGGGSERWRAYGAGPALSSRFDSMARSSISVARLLTKSCGIAPTGREKWLRQPSKFRCRESIAAATAPRRHS